MTDPKPPEFVGEVLADEPGLGVPIERLPELLEPVAVSAGALERLMSAVAEPPLRYAPFFERLSNLWDLSEADVRALFERSRDARAWRRAPLPGLELIKVAGGPRIAATEAYLARFAPGMTFPAHRHRGHEDVLVLEGSYTDSRGRVYRSGDVHPMEAGSEHSFTIGADEPCVAAAVHHGIRFSSLRMRVLAKLFGD
jgi:quercetin dioxygenase-like cupin family protein